MKNNFNKLWELTSKKFLALTILSHVSLMYVLILLPVLHLLCVITIAILILLFASVPVYHRFLSHRSWNCPRWYEIFASIFGVFSFTGSTISRTVTHRQHHAFADTDKDPHSPVQGKWNAFHGWEWKHDPSAVSYKYAIDLMRDPLINNL